MSATATLSHGDWKPKHNPWLIAVAVTAAAFMEILDSTIVTVSLPHIAGSLSVSYDEGTWTLTSYLVANGIVLMISGWLSTVLGRKRYFLICLGVFTLMSFLCGMAQNLPELVLFRLLQGIAGGGLQPTQQAIIVDSFPVEKRSAAFGVTALTTVLAPIMGPTLGGLITDNMSWRWIFFINVPVGLVALALAVVLLEDPPWAKARMRGTDYIGLSLIALGLGCVQIVLDRGETEGWFGSSFICVLSLLGFIGIVGAVAWLLTTEKPVVNLFILRDRNFAVGCVSIGMLGFQLYAAGVLIASVAQQLEGYTAFNAGLMLGPGALVVMAMTPMIVRLMKWVPGRLIAIAGFGLISFGAFYASLHLVPNIDFRDLVLLRVLQAPGYGCLFVPISVLAYSTLPREFGADAAALYAMFRNVLASIGISLDTALNADRAQVHQDHLAQRLTAADGGYNALVASYQHQLMAMGRTVNLAHAQAIGRIYRQLLFQSSTMAYADVFAFNGTVAIVALLIACFFSGARPARPAAAAAH